MRMTDVDICNHAIGLCGSTDWIQSLDDNSVSARRCKRFFEPAVERVLASHDWSCASRIVRLAQNTTSPTAEYQYAYALPNDCIKIVNVFFDDSGYCPYNRWKVRGRNIQTDLDAVYLEYVQFPEDYKDLDTLLGQAIAYELAVMLAPSLIKNPEIYGLLNSAKERECAKARAMDSMQDKELYDENSPYEDQRLRVAGTSSGGSSSD